MDQSISEVRMANWLTIAKQCQNRPNGQSARQWLAENGVPEKQVLLLASENPQLILSGTEKPTSCCGI